MTELVFPMIMIGAVLMCLLMLVAAEAIFRYGYRRCMKDWVAFGKTCDKRGRDTLLEGAEYCHKLRRRRESED